MRTWLWTLMAVSLAWSLGIRDLQYTTDPSGDSPYEGSWVTIHGVVTAGSNDFGNLFFIADSTGPWHGIAVYAPGAGVQRGDSVEVTGVVQEYYGKTEINASSGSVTVLASHRTIPEPYRTTSAGLGEPLEGVLVFLRDLVVVQNDLGYGEWLVQDSQGTLRVDDLGSYTYNPTVGDSFRFLRGVLDYSYGNFKLEPRDDADLRAPERPLQGFFNTTVAGPLRVSQAPVNLDSLVVARIGLAAYSVDLCVYSLSSWNVVNALKDRYDHGVKVRVIVDNHHWNSQVAALASYGIPVITDSFGTNLGEESMHHKFLVVDARDAGIPEDDFVLTGSYNYTYDPFGSANNVVFLASAEVAAAYTTEFNEMWGGSGDTPDPAASRFGTRKTDNTPHHFVVGGHPVSVYFSPSDGTEAALIQQIQQAHERLQFAMYFFTNQNLSNAMKARWDEDAALVAGVFDSTNFLDPGHYSESWDMLGLGGNAWSPAAYVYCDSLHGKLLHHKYLVVDRRVVVTGSANFTYSAMNTNDENVVIVQDSLLAQDFLQELRARVEEAGGAWPPGEVTILDLQAADPSPFENHKVEIHGVVSGVFSGGRRLFVGMRPQGPYRGLFVYLPTAPAPAPAVGDSVALIGDVQEYYGLTEMVVETAGVRRFGPVAPLVPVRVSAAQAMSEAYEGVLVRVDTLRCLSPDLGYGEWSAYDATDTLRVDDLGVAYEPQAGWFYTVIGPVNYSYGHFKLEPRDSSDILLVAVMGDADGDGEVTRADLEALAGYLYRHLSLPEPLLRADVNRDSRVDDQDLVNLSRSLMQGVRLHRSGVYH